MLTRAVHFVSGVRRRYTCSVWFRSLPATAASYYSWPSLAVYAALDIYAALLIKETTGADIKVHVLRTMLDFSNE